MIPYTWRNAGAYHVVHRLRASITHTCTPSAPKHKKLPVAVYSRIVGVEEDGTVWEALGDHGRAGLPLGEPVELVAGLGRPQAFPQADLEHKSTRG